MLLDKMLLDESVLDEMLLSRRNLQNVYYLRQLFGYTLCH